MCPHADLAQGRAPRNGFCARSLRPAMLACGAWSACDAAIASRAQRPYYGRAADSKRERGVPRRASLERAFAQPARATRECARILPCMGRLGRRARAKRARGPERSGTRSGGVWHVRPARAMHGPPPGPWVQQPFKGRQSKINVLILFREHNGHVSSRGDSWYRPLRSVADGRAEGESRDAPDRILYRIARVPEGRGPTVFDSVAITVRERGASAHDARIAARSDSLPRLGARHPTPATLLEARAARSTGSRGGGPRASAARPSGDRMRAPRPPECHARRRPEADATTLGRPAA